MKNKISSSCAICKIVAILAIVAASVAFIVGCASFKSEGAGTQLAAIIQLAYENGGREAVSNRIDELVVEGKLSQDQALRLQKLADLACDKLIEDLAKGEIQIESPKVESTDSSKQEECENCSDNDETDSVPQG